MPAPWEEVDGVTFHYFNNPKRFIQPHIALFQRERRHYQRYKEKMPHFDDLPLRWLQAEDCYERWLRRYEHDEWVRAQEAARSAASGGQ